MKLHLEKKDFDKLFFLTTKKGCLWRLLTHFGLDVTKRVIQTDNGSEFSGAKRKTNTIGFNHMLHEKYGVEQRFIP